MNQHQSFVHVYFPFLLYFFDVVSHFVICVSWLKCVTTLLHYFTRSNRSHTCNICICIKYNMKHIMWLWTYYYGINEHTILLTVILNNYGANNYCDWVEYKIQQKHMANWIQYVIFYNFYFLSEYLSSRISYTQCKSWRENEKRNRKNKIQIWIELIDYILKRFHSN